MTLQTDSPQGRRFTKRGVCTASWLLVASLAWPGDPRADQAFAPDGNSVALYTVARARTPIDIDGHLGEFAWESARQIGAFERILNDYDQIKHPTRGYMLWDDDHFYFAFVCNDPDMWAIFEEEDDPLWSEEVVEVFIDPDGDARNYLELEVNPLNAVVDLLIYQVNPRFESSKEWDIEGLKTAVQVYGSVNDSTDTDLGWTVEIAIPWEAMADSVDGGGRPSPGDLWRLNMYRIERTAGRDLMRRIRFLRHEMQPESDRIREIWKTSGADSLAQLSPGTAR